MSPEQAQGRPLDPRSDLFSLGSLVYELVTGASPFHAPTAAETMARICLHDPRPISAVDPSLPPELVDLVHRLLRKSPDERPQRTADVVTALEAIERASALDRTRQHPLANPALTNVPTEVDAKRQTPARPSGSSRTSSERRQVTVVCSEIAGLSGALAAYAAALDRCPAAALRPRA